MPILTNEELIKGCKHHDRKTQNYLYRHYYSDFLKICLRYATDMQDAEQWMNDGFYKIFTRIDQYKSEGSFEGWMKRIMVNTCLDHLRLSPSKRIISLDGNSLHPEMESDTAAYNDGLHNASFRELVAMIQDLPAVYKAVFNMYVFDGYSHMEIGKALNIKEGTSAWYLQKARMKLKEELMSQHSKTRVK